MKFISILSLIAILGVLTGCNTMKVTSTQDQSFDFSSIATYEWISPSAEILDEEDTYMHEALQQSLNNELANRGLKQVLEKTDADVQVYYYVKLREHEEYSAVESPEESQVSGGITFGSHNEGWGIKNPNPDLTVYAVETGTLTFIMKNTKTGKTVWTGTLVTKVDRSVPLEKLKEYFNLVASKITKTLPVQSK